LVEGWGNLVALAVNASGVCKSSFDPARRPKASAFLEKMWGGSARCSQESGAHALARMPEWSLASLLSASDREGPGGSQSAPRRN
jgi:hypothetical protein